MTMNLSELINQMVELQSQRKNLADQDSALSKQLSQLEADIMHAMSTAGTFKSASDAGHSVTMAKKLHPTITDWNEFYGYVTKTNSFDLLHKRLSSPAFRDRWEAGEIIPGSTTAEVWGISVTKSRK
jgi:hypothetical protein